jgi:hypothetical protein
MAQHAAPPQSTVAAVGPGMPVQQPPLRVGRKRRSPILLGCLVFLGLVFLAVVGGGVYVWRSASYTPPERKAPDIPERVAATLTEFPVDNDPNAPRPSSLQTEALGGSSERSFLAVPAKLPPGIDLSGLSKGATSMTSAAYRPKPPAPGTMTATAHGDIYICVLNVMPHQSKFGDGLITSVVKATGGQQTSVRVQNPAGGIYTGSRIRAPQASVYVLKKQDANIVVLIYSNDPSNQEVVDRLAQSVGNGQGLIDYPELKEALWTLPTATPAGLTLQEVNTITGKQLELSLANLTGSGNDELVRVLSQVQQFLAARMTGARYVDAEKRDWLTFEFEYRSTFQAWKTWLILRSALGLGGAKSTTVRNVEGLYLDQEGIRILIFQKGPYLIFLSGPADGPIQRMLALGDQFQV